MKKKGKQANRTSHFDHIVKINVWAAEATSDLYKAQLWDACPYHEQVRPLEEPAAAAEDNKGLAVDNRKDLS